ncbi:hypothetical protein Taro_042659 [Colocasia esculenta]|uniref:Uncharacterized protein n=1 Tax=Colocasia esculenta TaxID=4460 RepID=A0A843X000_COLES|nr:hypothetical protein [Colocasia esculenta]
MGGMWHAGIRTLGSLNRHRGTFQAQALLTSELHFPRTRLSSARIWPPPVSHDPDRLPASGLASNRQLCTCHQIHFQLCTSSLTCHLTGPTTADPGLIRRFLSSCIHCSVHMGVGRPFNRPSSSRLRQLARAMPPPQQQIPRLHQLCQRHRQRSSAPNRFQQLPHRPPYDLLGRKNNGTDVYGFPTLRCIRDSGWFCLWALDLVESSCYSGRRGTGNPFWALFMRLTHPTSFS